MKFEEFDARLSRLLQALPAGTIADLTDAMIAWWGGARVIYAWVGDGPRETAGARELDLGDDWWQFHDWLVAWIDEPRLSARPEATGRGQDTAPSGVQGA
jgi:hypothetical protein